MNSLAVNLSKEWREQRGALGVLAVVAFGAVSISAATLSRATLQDPLVAQWIVGLTVLATVMSIGADLLARERQRGLEFLARIPHGLERAARGKLCFFALTLAGAFAFGSMLAAGASLVRTGALPVGAFGHLQPSLWLPIALAVSLWVFAVSAWMPNSALTLPAAVFFLATFGWPAVLAMTNDAVYRPTPVEGVVFIVLCIAGAPVSAWASFVIGARRGRTRVHAALIGLAVAVPFFAPSWAWAGVRYYEHATRPFSIWVGQLGTNPRFAFLDVIRTRPDGTPGSRADEPVTAMIVDLDLGAPKFIGPRDASAFGQGANFMRYDSFVGLAGCPRFTLYEPGGEGPGIEFDGATGEAVKGASEPALDPQLPTPAEFGRPGISSHFSIRWAGCGQVLRYSDGKATRVLYRDIDRDLVVDAAAVSASSRDGGVHDVRVRPGRWLVHCARSWDWFDPATGERAPLACLGPKENLGPSLSDGRFILTADRALSIFDAESNERVALEVLDLEPSDLIYVQQLHYGSAPIPADSPSLVLVSTSSASCIGVLDPSKHTLRAEVQFDGRPSLTFLRVDGPRVTLIEKQREIVRYDLERGTREVLFDVADVN